MNVYAINPELIIEDRLPYLLNILKVKRVISFIEYVPSICESLLIYKANYDFDNYEDSVNYNIQQAVYKFNSPIYSPKYESGKWSREFLTQDIYKDSKAHNPIYNLEYCDDENVLVLINDYDTENYYKQFVRYSLNILKKYASEYHYETRICFVLFNETNWEYGSKRALFLHQASIYYNNKFCRLFRYLYTGKTNKENSSWRIIPPIESEYKLEIGKSYSIQNFKLSQEKQMLIENGHFYNPLLSYIKIKLKEFIKCNDIDLLDFFIGKTHLDYLFSLTLEDMRENYDDLYIDQEVLTINEV